MKIFPRSFRKGLKIFLLVYFAGTLALLFTIAATPLGVWLYEKQVVGTPFDALVPADAIVLLGGCAGGVRAFGTAKVFHAGKAPRIIVSGDTRYNLELLLETQIPREKIILDDRALRTIDHPETIQKVAGITPQSRIIVVSSTAQERRARFLFERAGFKDVQIYSPDNDAILREKAEGTRASGFRFDGLRVFTVIYAYLAWAKYYIVD